MRVRVRGRVKGRAGGLGLGICRLQLQVGGGRRAAAQVLGGGLGWAPGGAEVWGGGLVSGLLSGGG